MKKAEFEGRLTWLVFVLFLLGLMVYIVTSRVGLRFLSGKYLIWGGCIFVALIVVVYMLRNLALLSVLR